MFDRDQFEVEKRGWLHKQGESAPMLKAAHEFTEQTHIHRYTYQWTWMGLPIIQMPGDVMAMQEIVSATRPDVIIETGIAWGGSTAFYASLLEMNGRGKVIAVDRVLPSQNRKAIEATPHSSRIHLLEGSSVDGEIASQIKSMIKPGDSVMVVLDSNHTHAHVLEELRLYAPLVGVGNYVVVFDTVIETCKTDPSLDRPWGKGNNPSTAIDAFLAEDGRFARDSDMDAKILASYAPGGYLRRLG
jgi:cephalosporin hydroxylase